jgi:hypothetical protein
VVAPVVDDERTNSSRPAQARADKRCPACGQHKPLSEFYTTSTGRPSGYCKPCQRAISRRARRRRNAAVRALIATQPEAWRAALAASRDDDPRGGGDAA